MKKEPTDEFDDIAFRKSLSAEAAFQARTQQGMQPVIDIAGHPYYLNVRWYLLQPKIIEGDFQVRPAINLSKDCFWDDQHEKFLVYFDTKKGAPFKADEKIAALPKNVVLLKIPNTYEADPVGMAREDQMSNPRHYLEKFPIKLYHTAEIIALKNSPLMELVQYNQEKKQRQHVPRKLMDPASKGKRKS